MMITKCDFCNNYFSEELIYINPYNKQKMCSECNKVWLQLISLSKRPDLKQKFKERWLEFNREVKNG